MSDWIYGALSGDGASSKLAESRPHIRFGQIWCAKCDKPCEFDITGGHRLWSAPDSEGETQGYLYIDADCHGQHAWLKITFQDARRFLAQENPRMVIFDEDYPRVSEEPRLKLLTAPSAANE